MECRDRQIKRRMKVLNLRRRRAESPVEDIISALHTEVENSGHSAGIDMLRRRLFLKFKIIAKRSTVRDVIDLLVPGSLANRRKGRLMRRMYQNPGPNYLMHVDQYDKLAKYGFFIHGAIDGFSRKIMWLHLGNTNRDGATVLHFYLKCALSIGGIPKFLRVDGGTENRLMLQVHAILRKSEPDHKPYFVGRSVHNQRIERWWQFLRTHFTQFWMEVFTELVNLQIYDSSNEFHYQLLQFCFTPVLRNNIKDIVEYWNGHKVRIVSNSQCPAGVPEILFTVPEVYGKSDYRQPVESDLLIFTNSILGKPLNEYSCSDAYADICLHFMADMSLRMPYNVFEAVDLFVQLKSVIDA